MAMKPLKALLSLEDGMRILLENVSPLSRTERVPLLEAAGRVLAEPIVAAMDVPPFPRASMDGYAVIAQDTFGAGNFKPVRLHLLEVVHAADIASARTRSRFRAVAQEWLDGARPGAFNQALMELGATVCLPRKPACPLCPLAAVCGARQAGAEGQLPVKLRAREPVRIQATLLLVRRGGKVLLRQRPGDSGGMAGFWELPAPEDLPSARVGECRGQFRHSITHHRYAFEVRLASASSPGSGYRWFPIGRLDEIPLSTTARKALEGAGIGPTAPSGEAARRPPKR